MKRLLAVLLVLMMLTAPACFAETEQARVMTSFYPLYVFALNIFDGIDVISVECMTAPQTGCLHDYQLLVKDMMKLADSNMFIVCGAGMENYLPDVALQFPDLPIVDCSAGIDLIEEECADDHGHEAHEHSYNPHTWLDIDNVLIIVNTVASGAKLQFPAYADEIDANVKAYARRLMQLKGEFHDRLQTVSGKKIVTFHEAFPYFAKAYGLEIAAVIAQDHDEALSPARIAAVIEIVEENGLPPLFTEPQYTSVAAQTIAYETGARIYELDPLVTGDAVLTAYEDGMRKNFETLLEALR